MLIRGRLPGAFTHRGRHTDADHPERLAVLSAVPEGPVLEVGCGPRKTSADYVGIDLTPGGRAGTTGSAAGRASEADIAADGAALPVASSMFAAVVARHNLEHYVDPFTPLRDWRRALRPGGRLVVVVPDEARFEGRTLDLDPTHYHAFNESFLRELLCATGFVDIDVRPCIEGWSLLGTATKPGLRVADP